MQKERRISLVLVVVFLVLGLSACGSSSGDPASGRWEATADFGTFLFDVNSEGTRVTHLEYTIPECGNYHMSGQYPAGAWDGFSITDGAFSYDDLRGFAIEGNFDKSGLSASGEWKFSPSDCTLSGLWEAVPLLGSEGSVSTFEPFPTESSEIVEPEEPVIVEPEEPMVIEEPVEVVTQEP